MTSLLSAKILVAIALVGGATATSAVVMHERAPVAMVSAAPSQPAPPDDRAIPTVAEATATAPGAMASEETAENGANLDAREGAGANGGGGGGNDRAGGSAVAVSSRGAPGASSSAGGTTIASSRAAMANTATSEQASSGRSGAPKNPGAGNSALAGAATSKSESQGAGGNDNAGGATNAGGGAGGAAANPEPSAARSAPAARDTVAEEAALLRAANAALARGDGKTALARIDEHASRFPRGALSEEREAARVLALCAAGRAPESRAAATKFVSANPRSPFVAQVRRACTTQ